VVALGNFDIIGGRDISTDTTKRARSDSHFVQTTKSFKDSTIINSTDTTKGAALDSHFVQTTKAFKDSTIINKKSRRPKLIDTLDSGFNKIDRIIEELRKANIVFNAPETMMIKETRQIVLLMSTGLSKKFLEAKISKFISDSAKIGKIHTDTVKVSARMEAHLTGDGIIVRPITPITQLVREKEETRWEWTIAADEAGDKTLYLTLNAFINHNKEEVTQTIETYRRKIHVYVEPTTILLAWLDKHVAWIAGFIGSIATLFLGYYLAIANENRKERQRELAEKNRTKIIRP